MTTEKPVKQSPIFPAGKRWEGKSDQRFYESEATALIRTLLENPEVREDQDWAWQRWRSGSNAIKQD
jgi:hypothetical protein